ncbi:zf-HC2 domain-containing protein [Sporosarcina sp. FA9]|uniref:zf-HC2 domain-containing protein n=1 Tax=Sporosarcina sp. FA9 TaxID=3413030 RepID=UPI003F65CC3B
MNTCPEQVVHNMHAYLDGDISHENEQQLNRHLAKCVECRMLMDELSMPITFIQKAESVQAPVGFVDGVMARLPKEKSKAGVQRWLRRHSLLAAAAMFFVLMGTTLFTDFGSDQNFSVTKQPNLVIEGKSVLVPVGEIVKGDIVVRNGDLRVEGEVDGNITVIKGSKYMASTAVVTGTSEEIEELFDWLWYKMKKTVKDVIPSSKKDSGEVE